jgi:hypothetical protein
MAFLILLSAISMAPPFCAQLISHASAAAQLVGMDEVNPVGSVQFCKKWRQNLPL